MTDAAPSLANRTLFALCWLGFAGAGCLTWWGVFRALALVLLVLR